MFLVILRENFGFTAYLFFLLQLGLTVRDADIGKPLDIQPYGTIKGHVLETQKDFAKSR